MRYLIFLWSVWASSTYANTEEKIALLIKAQGLDEIWNMQLKAMEADAIQQADNMAKQVRVEYALPKESEAKIATATRQYILTIQSSLSSKEMVSVWAQAYGSKFTSAELDALLKHYNSPLGKKDVAAVKQATPILTEHMIVKMSSRLERAFADYVVQTKAIVDTCKCRK